jgi:hypothetical protein
MRTVISAPVEVQFDHAWHVAIIARIVELEQPKPANSNNNSKNNFVRHKYDKRGVWTISTSILPRRNNAKDVMHKT